MRRWAHCVYVSLARDLAGLEQSPNGQVGEVVAIAPNVAMCPLWDHRIGFPLAVERTS